jgi:hypothetical protein
MKCGLALLTMVAVLACAACSAVRGDDRALVKTTGQCVPSDGVSCELKKVVRGKCDAELKKDSTGKVIDAYTVPPCHTSKEEPAPPTLRVNGEPLIENTGEITFGTGTSVCYGPPIPSPPVCICTKKPCP